jgi:DNA polymerase
LKKKLSTYGLSKKAFVVCDSFKRLWREAHPATVKLWHRLEDGCRAAISNPGETFTAGKFKIRRDGAWLRILMPSGRYMCYPSPEVDEKGGLSYMGINQYTKQWQRIKTYSGKLTENLCQSLSRDVLYDSMPYIEAAGYEICLHVHDELITETPDIEEFSAEHLSQLMADNPPWAEGLPLAAAGFESRRYKKE